MMSETYREPASALPDAWIKRVFHELSLTFGTRFSDLWAGIEATELQRKWAQSLAPFDGAAIRGALKACEEPGMSAPTLPVFRGLCSDAARRNAPPVASLPAPVISHERREELVAKIAEVVSPKTDGYDYRKWAKELKARADSGERMLLVQSAMVAAVLGCSA